jgi:HD-GYP domain-containing protein (c-di-GMP phosphodiesterase class II)
MKALLVSDKKELKELLSFQITSQLPITIKECLTVKEAVDLLKKDEKEFQLLIAPYNGPESAILQYLRERKEPLPTVFMVDPAVAKPDPALMTGLSLIGSLDQANNLPDAMVSLLKDFLARGGQTGQDSAYCPIRTNLLIRVSPLKGDIYIRLSAEKFVKMFKSGDEFDTADLQKYYETKGVEYMYLRREETAEFIRKFRAELDELLTRNDVKQEEVMQTVEMSQEAIQELVHRVGFTEEVQELAKKNVQLTLKTIGAHPRLQDLLKKVQNEGNYLSQHSTLLAHVTCCIAKEMEWGSDSTFSKLVLASFMHDVSLSDPELAKINSMKELEERKSQFAADAVKGYHLHPARSADIVRNFKEIPADVDLIVQQHHERPNGSGFPRGLQNNYIAPLSAVFIVGHELTQAILTQKDAFSLEDFVEDKKPSFNQGNFKKVMIALDKVKL